jgi:magnesium chelatase subunit I
MDVAISIPAVVSEVIEQIAFVARTDKRIDRRSGVSQRLPISVLECVVSNAERRGLQNGECVVRPRLADIYSAIPAIVGKIELEYEGEQVGGDRIARELIRKACGEVFDDRCSGIDLREVLDHFNQGRTLLISEMASDEEVLNEFRSVSGLLEAASSGRLEVESHASSIVSCELLLEGLHALKKIARSEARGAANYTQARPERPARGAHYDDWTGGKVN